MSDAKGKTEPDAELLEFLGDIDEVNDENQDADFSDFLANNDIDKLKDRKPRSPGDVPPGEVPPEKVKNE